MSAIQCPGFAETVADFHFLQAKGNLMLHHDRPPTLRAALLILALGLSGSACAAEKKSDSSLALIPADAAYYSALLRNREQIAAIAKSKAWTKIQQMPLFQLAWGYAKSQYSEDGGQLAPLRQWVEQDENRQLLDVLIEALSDDVFLYGGASWVNFSNLMAQVNTARYLGLARGFLKGKGKLDSEDAQKDPLRAVLRVLARNPDKLRLPNLVLGFRITSTKKAEAQIKRLEDLLNAVAAQEPKLAGRVKRVKIGGGNFLTLNLDGSLLPWEEIPIKDLEEAAGEFDGVTAKLKELKLSIALGVRDNYLLLSLGADTSILTKLGGTGKRLADVPEIQPLVRAAEKRITSISYSSKALNASSGISQKDVQDFTLLARQGLEAAGVPDEKRKAIAKDVAALLEEMQKAQPRRGASLDFSFLSARGSETYEYEYGEFPDDDGSKPLTLLQHLGGNPIFATVGRSKGALEQYRGFAQVIQSAWGHAEPLLVEKLDKEQKQVYQKVRDKLLPIVKRFDEVTSQMLLPALADGQTALVIDAKWKSKQWQGDIPAMEEAMPMLELGLIVGVSDAELLEKAVKSYRKIAEDIVAAARELSPGNDVPPIKMPQAEVKTLKAGKLFVFRLPAEWKLDAQVSPTAGLSKSVGVFALSTKHAERLLSRKPLKIEGGPLADAKRPLAGATYFDWPALVEAIKPWVAFGAKQANLDQLLPGGAAGVNLLDQVRTVLDALKVFHLCTSATSIEKGVRITHSETVYRDE